MFTSNAHRINIYLCSWSFRAMGQLALVLMPYALQTRTHNEQGVKKALCNNERRGWGEREGRGCGEREGRGWGEREEGMG